VRRAAALDATGRYDDAIADLDRVIAVTTNTQVGDTKALQIEAYLARGSVHLHRQNSAAALKDFNTAVALDNTNAVAHASRGSVLQQLKRDEEAAAAYTRALALDPDFADARFARGTIYQRQNRLADAAKDFEAVAALPSASSATQLAARSRLERLGKAVGVVSQRSRVYLHISSDSDRAVAETVAKTLGTNAFDVQGIELTPQSSRGDVRYYFKEDERGAEQVRRSAESVIAERGYNVQLELRFLATKETVKAGTIEVWLPPLSVYALPGQQYARPASSRR
jgi:tetratricopeptide (TPR) repeat protein